MGAYLLHSDGVEVDVVLCGRAAQHAGRREVAHLAWSETSWLSRLTSVAYGQARTTGCAKWSFSACEWDEAGS